jgi:hypothetical protein
VLRACVESDGTVVADAAPNDAFGAVRTDALAAYVADDTDAWPTWALTVSV